jgi:exonuclease VII small subunit
MDVDDIRDELERQLSEIENMIDRLETAKSSLEDSIGALS